MQILNSQNQTSDVKSRNLLGQKPDFSQNIEKVFALDYFQKEVNKVTVLKCPIARNDKWRIQTLKNLSFLLNK